MAKPWWPNPSDPWHVVCDGMWYETGTGKGTTHLGHGKGGSKGPRPGETVWETAKYLGGKPGPETLPLEDRRILLRELMTVWRPEWKVNPIPMLSWAPEVMDAAIYLLTQAPRKTRLNTLGHGREQIMATLLESLEQQPTDLAEEAGLRRYVGSFFPILNSRCTQNRQSVQTSVGDSGR